MMKPPFIPGKHYSDGRYDGGIWNAQALLRVFPPTSPVPPAIANIPSDAMATLVKASTLAAWNAEVGQCIAVECHRTALGKPYFYQFILFGLVEVQRRKGTTSTAAILLEIPFDKEAP